MAELVNQMYEYSLDWQASLAWLKVNIGYLRSEMADFKIHGDDLGPLPQLLDSYEKPLQEFVRLETEFYEEARTAEREEKTEAVKRLKEPLLKLRECFRPFINAYHAEVEKSRGNGKLVSSLLMGCGTEILNAFRALVEAIDRVRDEVDKNSGTTV